MRRNEPERITLTDSLGDACIKLAEGNPGAVTVLAMSIRVSERVDPQSAYAHYTGLIGFDAEEIYGCRIWMLYKDVCKHNIIHTLALLRAVQMGILSKQKLNHAIDHAGEGLKEEQLLEVVNKLRERLPSYWKSDDPQSLGAL